MTKCYVSKTTINFVDFEFYVRPGDVLVHDTHNQNRLTVYRNGQIVKVVKQDPLGIVAFLKNRFIEEVVNAAPTLNPPSADSKGVVSKTSKVPRPTSVEAPTSQPKAEKPTSGKHSKKAEKALPDVVLEPEVIEKKEPLEKAEDIEGHSTRGSWNYTEPELDELAGK